MNEERAPQQEIAFLREELEELRRQLALYKTIKVYEYIIYHNTNLKCTAINILTGHWEDQRRRKGKL